MKTVLARQTMFCLCVAICWSGLSNASCAQYLRIRDICRVKGQEENTLQGLGLVVGLQGTGDTEQPTIRALAQMMELMGSPISQDISGRAVLDELENSKNVAMVFVTATIPPQGGRQGGTLNASVSAVSAKSLKGGQLLLTALAGPNPADRRVFAFAQGQIELDETGPLTSGKVHNGCRLEADFNNAFIAKRRVAQNGGAVEEQIITLVVDKNHASFQTAFDIADVLNSPQNSGIGPRENRLRGDSGDSAGNRNARAETRARALDQVNIEVLIPPHYRNNPVDYIAEILQTQIIPPRHEARVVINERNGSIVIGNNVMVGRVAVAHRNNLSIETADGPLFEVDQSSDTSTTRLKALVAALNKLKVSPDDIIEIIKNLERSGDLYGRVIIQ